MKTLTDPNAQFVRFKPRKTSVSTVRRKIPTGLGARARGVERTTYRIRATLVAAKLEDDSDIHLVVADPAYPHAR